MEPNKYGLEDISYKNEGDVRTELKRRASDGRYYPFLCHVQKCEGKGVMSETHVHEVIEFIFCFEGAAEAFLGRKRYCFKKGELLIINSNEPHKLNSLCDVDGTTKYAVVQFEPDILRAGGEHNMAAKYVMPFRLSSENNRRIFGSDEFGKGFIENIIYELLREYEKKEYGFELAIRSNISRLFLRVLRAWHEEGFGTSDKDNTLVIMEKVFAYVEQNYKCEVSSEGAARLVGMSYSYFSRFFKKASGMTFSNYINLVRITKSEELLTCTEKSITEIAMDVGFSSTSYFIARFREQRQMSPLKFRRQISNAMK